MRIRTYQEKDHQALRNITARCFRGVAIDHNIERMFGPVAGKDWQWRKKRDMDADIDANAKGIFVAEEDGVAIGYVSTFVDREAKMGRIVNFCVLPGHQGKGIGRKLAEEALAYFRREGLEIAKIETLEQNEVGKAFYPSLGFKEVARQIHFAMRLESPKKK